MNHVGGMTGKVITAWSLRAAQYTSGPQGEAGDAMGLGCTG